MQVKMSSLLTIACYVANIIHFKLYSFKIKAEILEALSVFDREDTGFLDRATVENLIRHLGEGLDEAEIEEFVGSLSYNGDGKISHEEFLKVVLNEN